MKYTRELSPKEQLVDEIAGLLGENAFVVLTTNFENGHPPITITTFSDNYKGYYAVPIISLQHLKDKLRKELQGEKK